MKKIIKLDISNNLITFEDNSQKYVDNYIFELREKFQMLQEVIDIYSEYNDEFDFKEYLKDFLDKIV